MANWDDVRRIAMALPEASENTQRAGATWRGARARFRWERPLRRSDLDALSEQAPKRVAARFLQERG